MNDVNLKGKCHKVLTCLVKNGELEPLRDYKIILEREERNQLNS